MKKIQFSPHVVFIILNTCVVDFCVVSVVWSVGQLMAHFMVFNLWIGSGFSL